MRLSARARGTALASLLLAALGLACSWQDEPQPSPATSPPAERPTDPGCTVTVETGLSVDAGQARTLSYVAEPDGDAGTANDAGPEPDAGPAPAPAIRVDVARTVSCRTGTTFDVAAAPSGGLVVAAAGLRGAAITFPSEPAPAERRATTRVLDVLRDQYATAKVSVAQDGQVVIVGTGEGERGLVVEENGATRRLDASDTVVLRPAWRTQRGTLAFPVGLREMLVRRAGDVLQPRSFESAAARPGLLGLDNEDQPFRIALDSDGILEREGGALRLGGNGAVRGVAAAALGPEYTLPAIALVRGGATDERAKLTFEVVFPTGETSLAHATLLAPQAPCPAEAACSNTCEETGLEVDPKEIAMTFDGTRTFVVFVRRTVTRSRRYRRDQSTGVFCDVFGCDPYCTSDVDSITTAAEIVLATIDPVRRAVDERYVVPLEAQSGVVRSVLLDSGDDLGLSADARDGFVHVSRFGTYQGSFAAVTTYRLRVAP